MSAPWITYRPEIKVLDCTIRDGGLVNGHHFDDNFVRTVYQTCIDAGVDYMEIGYKNSDKIFSRDKFGNWKFCREEDVCRALGNIVDTVKLAAMIDAGRVDWKNDVLPRDRSIFATMRVAFYVHQLSEAVDMIHDAYEKGYEVWANLMAASTAKEIEIDQALEILAQTPASVLVVVDSYGSMYAETIEHLVKKYLRLGKESGKEVGIHAHNNQQLAFANSIEAIIHGANRVDASIGGLGRGAGNCPMELLLGFLRNPKFKLRPVYAALDKIIVPLRKQIDWGTAPEYIITGQMNQHPRAAIETRENPELRDRYLEFYDRIVSEG
ncbi:MAG: aldolase catalytic domain-containing protein [Planctomycetaceae bacterium]|jgi:4-hydroxy 2-oxovalerate aldolase|nr:aldolase catalytic domain-containing protein [Planctomycetaceae bacterium]